MLQFDLDVPSDVREAFARRTRPDGHVYVMDERGFYMYDLLVGSPVRGVRRVRMLSREVACW